MSLSAGSRLGPYEIQASLGAGGMGEVYKARDVKLNRDVALKVLPDAFTRDPDRLARFKREAQVLASLNHPNIASIYGFEDSSDIDALVLELVEGPTLADRIVKGAMPLGEALAIARQIAVALEAAHEQGIIHRDLKPANIKLRPDGTVKVLDFGLAKALDPASAVAGSDPVHSPTLMPTMSSPAMTRLGVILGTAAYMAPEQARGKAVDKRADIWAFGAVLYELVTGRKAFDGEDVTETLAKVIQSEPRWNDVPVPMRRLLKRCLEKDPRRRLRDIGDVWTLLDDTPATDVIAVPPRQSWLWPSVAAVLAVSLGATLWSPWRGAPHPTERSLVRLDVDLGPDVSLPALTDSGSFLMPAVLSPDGTWLAYVALPASGQERLFLRRLDQAKAVELSGTEGAFGPFFSSDSRWLGFYVEDRLYKISVEGGAVVPLVDANRGMGAAWAGDEIVFGGGVGKGLLRIPATGGTPTAVTDLAADDFLHAFPVVLPGGKAVLFSVFGRPPSIDRISIDVVSLADHRRKTLVRGGMARYLAAGDGTGYLVYTNKTTLFAIPFDVDRLETHGAALPILDDVAFQPTNGNPQFDVSHDTLIYRRGSGAGASGLVTAQWVDSEGKRTPVQVRQGGYNRVRVSPDGNSLALIEAGSNTGVWVYDQARDATRRLTSASGIFTNVAWSPDGRFLVLGSVGTGIVWARADGASQPRTLLASKAVQIPITFSPDGTRLGYAEVQTRPQLWTVPIEETSGQPKAGTPERFLESQSIDIGPAFSPDGRWVAYFSGTSGNTDVYVRPFPPSASDQGGQWQVSNNGGTEPLWSPNGRDLLYRRDDQIMAVGYTVKGDAFIADKPRVWIAKLGGSTWDLAPDGQRVAVLTPIEAQDAPKPEHTMVLLLNFADELRRRVPAQ
jgi:serine/threonine-protein kinase